MHGLNETKNFKILFEDDLFKKSSLLEYFTKDFITKIDIILKETLRYQSVKLSTRWDTENFKYINKTLVRVYLYIILLIIYLYLTIFKVFVNEVLRLIQKHIKKKIITCNYESCLFCEYIYEIRCLVNQLNNLLKSEVSHTPKIYIFHLTKTFLFIDSKVLL